MFRCPSTTLPTSLFLNRLGFDLVSRLSPLGSHVPPFSSRSLRAAGLPAQRSLIGVMRDVMRGATSGEVREFMTRVFPSSAACVLAAMLAVSAPVRAQQSTSTAAASDVPVTNAVSPSDSPSDSSSGSPGDEQAASPDTPFGARQKVLDQRTEENNYRFGVAQHDCYSKFFVNYCLGKARDNMRIVQADIHKEQLALDGEQRTERARQRDEQAALRRAQDEAAAPQRTADDQRNAQAYQDKQRQHQIDQAQRAAETPQRNANAQAYQDKQRQHALDQAQRGVTPSQAAANQQAYDQKQGDYQRKLDEARQQGAQKAQERDQKQQSYEKKQTDAAQHKADVEARQKQAAEKAEQKRQDELKQQQQLDEQKKLQQQQQ